MSVQSVTLRLLPCEAMFITFSVAPTQPRAGSGFRNNTETVNQFNFLRGKSIVALDTCLKHVPAVRGRRRQRGLEEPPEDHHTSHAGYAKMVDNRLALM